MDYYQKYLKYKNKYIKLQKQSKFAKQLGGDWTCKCTFINADENMECTVCGRAKPRVAGTMGETQRKATDQQNKELDKQLERNMGTSTDRVTKKGEPRKEYYGK